MNRLHRLITSSILKWGSSIFPRNHLKSPSCQVSICISRSPTSFTSRAGNDEKIQTLKEKPLPKSRSVIRSRRDRERHAEAQSALLENLHGIGNLLFTDAEHMSQNCPIFIHKLLQRVEDGQEIRQSLIKLFRYHPINEFEPFFESIGLTPSELSTILPRKLMFLREDPLLLENYRILCDYGIPRNLIGRFYKEAPEVFRCEHGVLHSKLHAYEDLGLTQSSVIKVVSSSPSLLIGGSVSKDFVKALNLLTESGIEFKWIEGGLSDKNSYDWRRILWFLEFICELGYSKDDFRTLIERYPVLLLDASGKYASVLVGFLLKFGFTRKEMSSFLLQFPQPQPQLSIFLKNLRRGFLLLMEIEMDAKDIGNIVRGYPFLLGSSSLKKPKSLCNSLEVRKKRLCNIIKEDPCQLKNWVLRKKVEPWPKLAKEERIMAKTEFLLRLNFIENSGEFRKAFKRIRGKGGELQERFDCLLKVGIDQKDVIDMIRKAPHILSQRKEVIEEKINCIVNEIHYPISYLVQSPSCLSFTLQQIRLRFSMYRWLQAEGLAAPKLALSSFVACTEEYFVRQYVNRHPKGLEIWENLKKNT